MKLERDGLARLDEEGRHDGAGDDELAGAQAIAELRRDGGDMANDVDQVSGVGLEIVRHIERAARSRHATDQSIETGAGTRRVERSEHHVPLKNIASQDGFDVTVR